jgi:1-deoxy-D-xylulose-5-phosphate reductoisomerase
MTKSVTILGASGSIGTSAVSFLRLHRDLISLDRIALRRNWRRAIEICLEFGCRAVAFEDVEAARSFSAQWEGPKMTILSGPDAAAELASWKADVVLAAISGSAGLPSVLAAIQSGNRVALANKEALVCGGNALLELAREQKVPVIPVDSEHSAMFQALLAGQRHEVASLVLTASGGPFRQASFEEMRAATKEQALAHPNWPMGPKNTIDSATLANKGLELIEASYLFGFAEDKIDVVINPSSVLHSAVLYRDGSMIAQLGTPDMRSAVGYGLTWPDRLETGVAPLSLAALGRLEFEEINQQKFKALSLARQALREGQDGPMIFNFANEVGVAAFLKDRLRLTEIAELIETCLERGTGKFEGSLKDLPAICDAVYYHCLDVLANLKARD